MPDTRRNIARLSNANAFREATVNTPPISVIPATLATQLIIIVSGRKQFHKSGASAEQMPTYDWNYKAQPQIVS